MSAPAARPRASGVAAVWLHATGPDQGPVLEVLAEQLGEFRDAPEVVLTGTASNPGPPSDDPRAIEAFLDANPVQMLVLAGSRLPVAMIDRARAHGVVLFLINARLPITPDRWRLIPGVTRSALGKFAQLHAQDATTAAGLRRQAQAATAVFETGRLASHAPTASCNAYELESMRETLGARPVWFAYDLPSGEAEAALLAARRDGAPTGC
ncbi:MAG: hypothetical protein KJZ59_00235 [Pararhodobacter sp.]|nr:hypothetical protein [Pararhodobacter sp.]